MDKVHTQVVFDARARKRLFSGMTMASKAISATLGPKGKCVLIQKSGAASITTKDGVTVARAINLEDPVEGMGAELIKEAASQTNESAGDGTTTATVLTHAMVSEGLKLLEAGYSSTKLVSGISLAVDRITQTLKSQAVVVNTSDQVVQVGTISANGDSRIGTIIADAMNKVGRDGIITVEDAKGMTTTMDAVEGMQFDRGYLSPFFVTNNDKMNTVYVDAYVLVTDRVLNNLKELLPVLEQLHRAQKALLIIADSVEGEALQALVLNRVRTNLQVVAVKAPGYGPSRVDLLNDICAMTGAKLVSASTGLSIETVTFSELGTCKKFVVDAKSTTIVGDGKHKQAIEDRLAELRAQSENVVLDVEDVASLRVRIAKLGGGVAIIKVGGTTEIEMIERKYRIEDALHATRAATEEGIVPGGGSALIHAWHATDFSDVTDSEERAGVDIVKTACFAPLRIIVQNAGGSADVVVNELMSRRDENKRGYDAMKNAFVDMYVSGVIDPVKVTRVALQNAASIASTFLTLDAVIFYAAGVKQDADD